MHAIEVTGLWKQYRFGRIGYGTLRHDVQSWWARVRGREDPNAPIHAGRRSAPKRGEELDRFWALEDLSFTVEPGEVLGIIGRNGAGKSTLLKILSRVTAPTRGQALLRGRLASLLEVGTGFHPDLSGRENIFLNGAILGMRRDEVRRSLDEIIAFAGIEAFVDTPVKRYSSGMYVRLAFAVAAHLEADILLVDEVLAVGDAAFQRKSLGRMEGMARSGRTVLYVSHNLSSVRALCTSILVLEGGRLAFAGETRERLERYELSLAEGGGAIGSLRPAGPLAGALGFDRVRLRQEGAEVATVDPTRRLEIVIEGVSRETLDRVEIALGLFREGFRILSCHDSKSGAPMPEGPFRSHFELPPRLLRPGRFVLGVGARRSMGGDWAWIQEAVSFEVSEVWDSELLQRDTGAISVPVAAWRETGTVPGAEATRGR